jgi:meiotically up-regulated gene 157 (Mug157) protein
MTWESKRPAPTQRRFVSEAAEGILREVTEAIADEELAWLFSNCFPNTLDTTVFHATDADGRPDTFVMTGDIQAMWLRDSTNQVWPYLPLVPRDAKLREMFRGLINRQAACVRIDPYANAFLLKPTDETHWKSDQTLMQPGVHERKYELDSLCAVMRLATGYYFQTRDASCFDTIWLQTIQLILETIAHEQADSAEQGESPRYRFQRETAVASDTLNNQGRGNPFRRTGMSRCAFRPSDDATTFQYLVPANAMAVACLRDLAKVLRETELDASLATQAARLADQISAGIAAHALVDHKEFGRMYAYEIDGFGGVNLMDDANTPSLLSLPYLGYCATNDPLYQATRNFALSAANPFFAAGQFGEGIASPHIGNGWIWPMSIAMRGITSSSESEIVACLRMLKQSHAGTGFMHESFWKDDPKRFTRAWFCWANSLFGEFVLKVFRENPALLRRAYQ